MIRLLLPVVFTATVCQSAVAQEVDQFDRLSAQLQYRLTKDGRMQLKPDPGSGIADGPFVDMNRPNFMGVFENGGAISWLAMAYQGDTDIASMADSESILRHLGRTTEAKLFAMILNENNEHYHDSLLRLLAIRQVALRGTKPAIGALQKALDNGIVNRHTRRAAQEALAQLRGQPAPAEPLSLQSPEKVFRHVAGRIDYAFQYDLRGLPAARRMLAWGREIGLANTKKQIRRAGGGGVSLPMVAGATMLAELPGNAPYEVARRFGNHRIIRILALGRLASEDEQHGAEWMHIDGVFDVKRLRAGLVAMGLESEIGEDAEKIMFSMPAHTVTMTQTTITSRPTEQAAVQDEATAAAQASFLRTAMSRWSQDAASIQVDLIKDARLPMLPDALKNMGLPKSLTVWLPKRGKLDLKVRLVSHDKKLASFVETQGKGLPRLFEQLLERQSEHMSVALEPLLEALQEMKIVREGNTVTAATSLGGIDPEAMVRDGVKALGKQ